MNPGLAYWWIFHTVSLILAFVFTVIVGLVGYHILKPDKLLRIVFPYIKRKGNRTAVKGNNTAVENEMFGSNLSKGAITLLFFMALKIIFYSIWIFFSDTFAIYEGYNNPYSIKLNCFYDNGTLVELSSLKQTMEPVWCYAINTNIAKAAGLATGALAVAWLIASIETWIIIKVKKYIGVKNGNSNKKKQKKIKAYHICYVVIILTITAVAIITIWTNRNYFTKEARNVFLLENIAILIIPFEMLIPLMCIRNLFKKRQPPKFSKDISDNNDNSGTEPWGEQRFSEPIIWPLHWTTKSELGKRSRPPTL